MPSDPTTPTSPEQPAGHRIPEHPDALLFTADPDALLTEAQAAKFLNLSDRTLQAWRLRGGGPPFVRCGRCVRYRRQDLRAYVDARIFRHTTDASATAEG